MQQFTIPPVNINNLYQRTSYTDVVNGTVVESIPILINDEGDITFDPVRTPAYQGECFMNGQPLVFPIPAKNLKEAVERWVPTINGILEEIQSKAIQDRIARPGGMSKSGLVLDGKLKR